MGLHDRGYYRDSYSSRESQGFSLRDQSAVWVLIILNVVVFVLDNFSNRVLPGVHWVGLHLGVTTETLARPWLWWQFLTAGFCHAPLDSRTGVMHIVFNMFALWMFGRPVEERYGRTEFYKIYLLAILISFFVWALINAALGREAAAVGASGAVSTILMLFIFNFPRHTILFMMIFPMPAWVLGVVVVVSDVLNGLNPNSRIAWEAHLAGLAFGALYFRMGWNFHWLKLEKLGRNLRSGPKLKVHHPDQSFAELQEQADPILEKIAQQGEASLTAKERKILNEYSRQVRDRRKPGD